MAGGRTGSKRGRSPTTPPPADKDCDYVPEGGDSDDSTDWEHLPIDTLARPVAAKEKGKKKVSEKGKEKKKLTEKEKGKKKVVEKGKGKGRGKESGRKKTIGIEIREPAADSSSSGSSDLGEHDVSISSKRRSMFSSKLCIGERNVGVPQLIKHAPALKALFDNGNLYSVCKFEEQTGYGLELVREFYLRAGSLEDAEGGPFSFKTSVRGVEMTITPDVIASLLDMEAKTDGTDFLHSDFESVRDWMKLLKALSVPDTVSNGILIMSKDLKLEYRFLNFVVCYNVMPLANTKIVRWDRMLYMYLLGHPDIVRSRNINLNVPFLIWRRMAKDMKGSSHGERLPFPLLIMRLLRKFKVDTRFSSFEHSLGVISETTLAKSSSQVRSELRRSPTTAVAAPSSSEAAAPTTATPTTAAQYCETLLREVRRLSAEVAEIRSMVQDIYDKLGCSSPPPSPPPPPAP